MKEIKVLAVTGMTGSGFPEESFLAGMAADPDIVGMDAGSTDGGANPLGSGAFGVSPVGIKRDLSIVLSKCVTNHKRLIIGSAGTAGGNIQVEKFLELFRQIKAENNLRDFKVAVVRSELDKDAIKKKLREGLISPMPGLIPPLTEDEVDRSSHIVAQMGVEPFIQALQTDADVILTGRSCDTAIYACYPIMMGISPALAFHAAKIMECGAYATDKGVSNDSLLATFTKDWFELEPLNPALKCTPMSVAEHTMYENGHPYVFSEPDGTLDCGSASFVQIRPNAVRSWGAVFTPAEPGKARVKLEGARAAGYRSISIIGVHEPAFIARYDEIVEKVKNEVFEQIGTEEELGYTIQFRAYGKNAVLQELETHAPAEHEIGIVIDVVADTQEAAHGMAAAFRSSIMHMPYEGRQTIGGNIAFSFTPLESDLGILYEFNVWHLMQVEDMKAWFPCFVIAV